jgi:hypothetical protein
VRRLLTHSQIRVLAHGYRIRTIKLESGLINDSGYVVLEYVSQKLIEKLREKLQRRGLEIRMTDDRKGYVPMPNRLSRDSEPDAILAFVLRVLAEPQ